MIIKIAAAITLLFLLNSCEKETGTNPLNLTFEIQPLNTGNTWYYVDSTMSGGELNIDSIRITVSGKTTLNGQPNSQGVAIWDTYKNNIFLKRNLLNLEEDGLYHYAEINNDDTLFIRKLWAKYPVNVGDQFLEPKYSYNSGTGEYQFIGNWKWHCVSIDSQITIHNGTKIFCHIFRAEPESGKEVYLIYSLNVGYAGLQINQNGERIYRQILLDYILK